MESGWSLKVEVKSQKRQWWEGGLTEAKVCLNKEGRQNVTQLFSHWVSEGKKGNSCYRRDWKRVSQKCFSNTNHTVVFLNLRRSWNTRERSEFCWDVFEWLRSSLLGLHKFFCLRTFNLWMFMDNNRHSPEHKLVNSAYRQQMLHDHSVILVSAILLAQAAAFSFFDHSLQ